MIMIASNKIQNAVKFRYCLFRQEIINIIRLLEVFERVVIQGFRKGFEMECEIDKVYVGLAG